MVSLATKNVAQGTCFDCQRSEQDRQRSDPMGNLPDHVEMEHERELAPGTTQAQIFQMHVQMHRQDPRGEQYGHMHIGRDERVLRTRGRR